MLLPRRLAPASVLAASFVFSACGGTSVHPGDDSAGRAGMSGSGAGAGTGGTAAGGRNGGSGGNAGNAGNDGCSLGCPTVAPLEGDACSSCYVGRECRWDQRPVDGPLLFADCVDGQWHRSTQNEMPSCCTTDAQCAPSVCASGTCLPRIDGHCWADEQCQKGEVCSGGYVCSCEGVCGRPSTFGTCVPDDIGCCRDDSACPAENDCVAGICKARLPSGSACWRDADCTQPGAVCNSPSVCPCGADCLVADQPGACVIPL